ncbi:MAG TPA: glycosyltransferase [Terracidiphilus sp.]|nr:glycosyltransferase [Terracidiphilus sp.]
MRLLHVIRGTDPETGGPIEALIRISEVLMRDGHEVEVVSLEEAEDARRRNFPFPITGLGEGVGRYHYNARLKPWLRERANNFDAVVLHGLWNYSSMGAWRALRRHATPYFIFTHGMMDPWFRERYPLKHLAKQMFWLLGEGLVLRDANAVLFTCEEERLRSRNAFWGFDYRERVALLGTADPRGDAEMEKAAFSEAYPQLHGRKFLLFLSRIHPKKGCDLLVEAFGALAKELPDHLDLVMAGPDALGWIPELEKTAKTLGMAHRIHWVGMLKGALKWGALRSAEALILPSHQENFGIVVAEAMACSTPVLISNKVNIWREVEASEAGLAENDDAEGTRSLIRRFCALGAEERARMKTSARAGFLKYFDIENTAQEFARAIGFSE